MIFTLRHYNDLGRCSYGTLKEKFDTEKDEIYLNEEKVQINSIEDLFPFLWQSPGISFSNKEGKSIAYFSSEGTHWHHDYDRSIIMRQTEINDFLKKIKSKPDSRKIDQWHNMVNSNRNFCEMCTDMLKRLDNELEKQKLELIKENKEN
jgi:hypothetical protein